MLGGLIAMETLLNITCFAALHCLLPDGQLQWYNPLNVSVYSDNYMTLCQPYTAYYRMVSYYDTAP